MKVKQGEDSEEDIEIISSDQYYATLPSKSNSLKLKLTPIKHRSILPGKATMSHPTLFSFASTASASKTYPISFQEKSIFELPTTILPLQFSLFISYIYIGSMAPTLLLATDDKDSCTWEALYHVGYTLRSAGFMNYCMEGLRELRSVRKGIWPSPTEAKLVWKMDMEMGGLNMAILDIAGLNNDSSLGVGNADSDTRSSSDSDILSLDGKMSPLHEFVVACIAYNLPMSSDQANTPNYRAWKRLLSSKETTLASLSIMVHAMNRKMFMGKEPWNDEFRGLWEIVEEDVSTRWREILEKRKGQSEGVRKETRDGIESVQELLERMALRGESGLSEDGDVNRSESGIVSVDEDECDSDMEEVEEGDEYREELNRYESLNGDTIAPGPENKSLVRKRECDQQQTGRRILLRDEKLGDGKQIRIGGECWKLNRI
ncbi:uncharacterized protein RSE6_13085 [Rhynchosporium secalis]|uniref:Uncharacterized protein n=1 Tax=Rhynchosporium secalis TaxID=38038 RepID=A0A1E1MRZ6_RHYSE|nr:uncharacterized protein RSE6_13085 [Rhynchosporium secalis]